jgi:Fe-S cluster assembly ATP-binding protein
MALLTIKNLKVRVEEKEILHGLDLQIGTGEVHAIMGPNGSGKSTLATTLMGHPRYQVTSGSVKLGSKDLLALPVEQRAAAGLFLAFQYPKEIPGVNTVAFLRAAYNNVMSARKKSFKPVPLYTFKKTVQTLMEKVQLPLGFLNRNVNEGFSGGEKKKLEVLQMALLEPKLAVLDETDSGLDIDALQAICKAIKAVRAPEQSIVMITHYERMLKYLKPDFVHIMIDGRIVMSGGKELAKKLEKHGYDYVRRQIPSSLKVL